MSVHKFRKRYGRKISANKLELHSQIGGFENHLLKRGDANGKIDHETIQTIHTYQEAGRPLDYIDFMAHTIRETGSLDPDDLQQHAFSFRRLTQPYAFFASYKQKSPLVKGKAPGVFPALVAKDLFRKIKRVVGKTRKPLDINEITKKVFGATAEEDVRDVTLALNVFDALGEINKLPADSTKGKKKNFSYLPTGKRMPVPKTNIQYAILVSLLSGSMAAEEIAQQPSLKRFLAGQLEPVGWGDMKGAHIIIPAISLMVDEGLVRFNKTKSPRKNVRRFVFRLTPSGRKHVKQTVESAELSEAFRQRLLGTKQYGLSKIDRAHLDHVLTWVRVRMMDESLRQERKRYDRKKREKRKRGTGPYAIAKKLGIKHRFVEDILYRNHVPKQVMEAKPERLNQLLLNIKDLEEKAWFREWLKKEKMI